MMSQFPTIPPYIIKESWSSRSTISRLTIGLYNYRHGDENRIGLHFPFEDPIITFLTRLKYVIWSQPDRCYYILDNQEQLKALLNHCRGTIWLDMTRLHPNVQVSAKHTEEKGMNIQQTASFRPIAGKVMKKIHEMKRWMEQRRYSANTIKSYVSFVIQFFKEHVDLSWDGITKAHIVDYNHAQFIQKKKSYSTQNQWINAVKIYLQVHNLAIGDLQNIERPNKKATLPNILTLEEVQKIFKHTTNLKHRTILMLVYSAGLRIGEALNIKIGDVRSEEGLIYIRGGKGCKDRRVPLSPKVLGLLRNYYEAYQPSNYLFEGNNQSGKYSKSSARKVFKKALIKSGIKQKVVLHGLRHAYATHLSQRGVNVQHLQKILGHKSPKTTMLYTHLSGNDICNIKSPIDDMDI